MYISRLKLTDFRNYRFADLSFTRECIYLRGENAQGKTNLLEALFLCATGRSHRTANARDMVRIGTESAGVKILVKRAEGPQTIDFHLHGNRRHDIYINGIKTRRLGELMGHFNCVLFAPEDLNLVKDGPSVRRRFLDMELSQLKPAYFYALQRYQRALKQRNNLLKAIPERHSLLRTLPAWDEQLAQSGAYILTARRAFCEKLALLAAENHASLSGGKEQLAVRYEPGIAEGAQDPKVYYEALRSGEAMDLKRRTSLTGIHRDDLAMEIGSTDIRSYGSQGQQRTAAIALKLSELRLMRDQTGQWPVLLLDDVLSELDAKRQELLLAQVKDVQAFITGTTATVLPPHFARELTVSEGSISGFIG